MRYLPYILLTLLLVSCDSSDPLSPSKELSDVPVMEFIITSDDYGKLVTNRLLNYDVPVKVEYQGNMYEGKVRASGGGSRYKPQWSYKVTLKGNQRIEGLKEFNLSSQAFDKTMMHTELVSYVYKQLGFNQFEHRHIFLRINGEDQALLLFIERVEEAFFERRGIDVYELVKVGFGSKFSFEDPNYPQFHFEKDIPDDANFGNLIELLKAVDTSNTETLYESLSTFINLNNYITYHAATSILNNDDAFANNFYLWKEQPKTPYVIIPWDYDKAFRRELDVGYAGGNGIIEKLFTSEEIFALYKNEIIRQLNFIYTEENLFPIIDARAEEIRDAYDLDPYLGKGRYDLDEEIEELKQYITDRRNYLLNNLDELTQNYFED